MNAFQSAHRGTPRPELLKDWERIAKANKNSAVANQMVRDYQALIAEDRVWKEPDSKVLAKMTAVQKAAYWMHHLRDLDVGSPYFGGCHVLGLTQNRGGGDQKKPNAAVELANLGFDALPLVIDHLDDTRPTRCLAHERDFVQSSHRSYKPDTYYLLRYGDCCQQIFEGITGHTLYQGKTVSHFPTSDGVGKDLKKEAARWWQEFQKKGEKQMLIEGTERGDRSSAEQGRRLAAKFPADALAPIITGLRKCKNEWQRNSLVHSAGELSAEQATAFLMEELKTAFPLVRVTAARALVPRRPGGGPGRAPAGMAAIPVVEVFRLRPLAVAARTRSRPGASQRAGGAAGHRHGLPQEAVAGPVAGREPPPRAGEGPARQAVDAGRGGRGRGSARRGPGRPRGRVVLPQHR